MFWKPKSVSKMGAPFEVEQGSDPNNPDDGGEQPDDGQIIEVPFVIQDPSTSTSEKWEMTVRGQCPDDFKNVTLAAQNFGGVGTGSLKLRKWNKYEVRITHLDTEPDFKEDNDGKSDYDWEATVDGKPTDVSLPETDEDAGSLNFFMVGDHWLVDNRQAVFTKHYNGDDVDRVTGKVAYLVPVKIRDNTKGDIADPMPTDTGVDDVSITAEPTTGGYQDKFWIMAPAGGTATVGGQTFTLSNDMHFNIPLSPPVDLEISCKYATITPQSPYTTSLSPAIPPPTVTWTGTGSDTVESIPTFKIGRAKEEIDLPIKVKTMKKRQLKITVFGARRNTNSPDIAMPEKDKLVKLLNKVYGYQINAWTNEPTYRTDVTFDYDPDGDGKLEWPSDIYTGLSNSCIDENADLVVILIGGVILNTPSGSAFGIAPLGSLPVVVNTSMPKDVANPSELKLVPENQLIDTIAHEMGHRIIGPGHPDDGGGEAPLEGTDRKRRLMAANLRLYDYYLLVKTEWDKAEGWMTENIDK
jgi:hypothetical protein